MQGVLTKGKMPDKKQRRQKRHSLTAIPAGGGCHLHPHTRGREEGREKKREE